MKSGSSRAAVGLLKNDTAACSSFSHVSGVPFGAVSVWNKLLVNTQSHFGTPQQQNRPFDNCIDVMVFRVSMMKSYD